VTETTPPGSDFAAPAINSEPLSIRQASQDLAQSRRQAPEPEDNDQEQSPAQDRGARDERGRYARTERDEDSGDEPDAAPDDGQDHGETDADDPAPKEPSIDPPRSWTKAEKEAFKALPPEHQRALVERERARELEVRRGQNEVAQQRKAADAQRLQYEQRRQQYEAALPQLVQRQQQIIGALHAQQGAQFADLKTMDDVRRLATEDPIRFGEFQAYRMQVDHAQRELQNQQGQLQQARAQRNQEGWQAFGKWASSQDAQFLENAPEFRDPTRASKAIEGARNYLVADLGFSPEELAAHWERGKPLYLRDAKMQALIRDGFRFREAEKARKTAPKGSTPSVQKPGTAAARTERGPANLEALRDQADNSQGLRNRLMAEAALLKASRQQGARRPRPA
jgi:hypothetical protein